MKDKIEVTIVPVLDEKAAKKVKRRIREMHREELTDRVVVRRTVLTQAMKVADEISAKFPLEPVRMGGPAFYSGGTLTPADQYLSIATGIADWLVGD